jgi:hypothetical protein
MTKLLACLLLFGLSLPAAELTGKWSGSFDITKADGDTKSDTAYMDLKEARGTVTGTAGPNTEKQMALRKGKLDGQTLTFEVATEDEGVLVFQLTFDGDVIRGSCAGTDGDGEKLSAKLLLKPVK